MLKYPVHLNLYEYIRFIIIGQALAGYRDGIRILQEKVR